MSARRAVVGLIAGLLGSAGALAQPAESAGIAASAASADIAASVMPASAEASAAAAPAEAPALAASAAAPSIAATVQQPRAFGHVLGDVLTQRVLLQHQGRTLQPAALPAADRIGLWLERRTPRVETDAEGRRWLAIDHQVINAPRALLTVSLPALQIATTSGTTLALAAWPISIGPLTPSEVAGQGALQSLRPDRPVAPRPTAALQRQMQGALAALAVVLALWAAWWAWRQSRDARRLPFARAWGELRGLARRGDALAQQPEAWLSLHRAINASAGRVVHGATLPRLLSEAPQWQPLAAQLEAFYRASAQRFFADAPAAQPYPLLDLCRALRQVEKAHAR